MLSIPMTDSQFAAATTRLRTNGITAKYEHANGKLTIEVVDKPVLLPLSLIEGRLQAYLEQSIAAGDSR